MHEKWTNKSSLFSRTMKPKPLVASNHFTVPFSRGPVATGTSKVRAGRSPEHIKNQHPKPNTIHQTTHQITTFIGRKSKTHRHDKMQSSDLPRGGREVRGRSARSSKAGAAPSVENKRTGLMAVATRVIDEIENLVDRIDDLACKSQHTTQHVTHQPNHQPANEIISQPIQRIRHLKRISTYQRG